MKRNYYTVELTKSGRFAILNLVSGISENSIGYTGTYLINVPTCQEDITNYLKDQEELDPEIYEKYIKGKFVDL